MSNVAGMSIIELEQIDQTARLHPLPYPLVLRGLESTQPGRRAYGGKWAQNGAK